MSRRMRWIVPGGALAAALAAAVFLFMRHPLEIAAWLQRRELQGKGFDAVELGPADERLTLFAGGSGPPLVFLHGVGDHAGGWSKVAPAFRDRFRVFVPDLPGHGESEPAAGELPMATVVAGAERVLAVAAQDGPAVVVGNSMGAWVSTLLAERHPRQVSRLVLVGGGALLGETGGPSLQPRDRAAAAELMAHVRDPSSPPLPGFVLDALVRRAEAGPFARVSADATGLGAHLLDEDRLRDIAVPVDLLWGASDRLVPIDYARRLRASLPAARLTLVERCGHVPQVECPERFLAELEQVLASPPPEPEGSP